ncbi:hypothetical protein LD11_gp237 [Bacillus phage Riley]|uniref:Uncharacterized protein n=4 Tax=Caudoviricetes TaxID=2731619 RepID=A0A075LYX9_9CAUD|nr:hypothetical protein LD11_gp237 [Bacillus phage Riley]YP_009206596.1 hypothetical protein AVV02_gp241 [Bacillus phage AvesoBmore]AGM61366.1 hypothetical protein BTP1_57 [Bacillus phage phiBTP1]ULF48861.1 hypothetical protein [Bacillus phage BillyBob]AIF72113.1 hypothetical protein [Bacillus phage Riley]ALA13398.1 hypothetical protein AVESOBMORE_241 [Bacillus phage AvesoBmore]
MSNINVNITYVITGYDELNGSTPVLYAGHDEQLAEAAVKTSILCDFEKEVWHNGQKVQVLSKSRIESKWGLREDKLRKMLVDALEASNKMVEKLDKVERVKGLLCNQENPNLTADNLRDISNNVNTIKHIMEDLYAQS